MIKKTAILWLSFIVIFMTACGGNNAVQQPEDEENRLDERYATLQEAISDFSSSTSGTIQIIKERNEKYVDISGENVSDYSVVETKTIDFTKSSANYNFIEIVETKGWEVPEGYRQSDGVFTKYHYVAYPDGTFQWTEGAAELSHYSLPQDVSMLLELTEIDFIDSIMTSDEGDYVKYNLLFKHEFFDFASQASDYNNYELKGYDINYFIDNKNQLSRIVLEKNELWAQSEMYDVVQTTVFEIDLIKKNKKTDLDYFRKNGTYTKPIYNEITEIWREEFINIPETSILDVRIPKLKATLPNAEKINKKIAADCALALNATVEDLEKEIIWADYPWRTVDFSVHKFGDVYQICIFNTEACALGSGINMWMYTYYYDIAVGDAISQDNFLRHMGFTREEIVAIFHNEYLGGMGTGDSYTYDEISDWYYFDEDRLVQFYVNLYN